ncbi:hypothetical protein L3X38_042991 [Prunus dulcis]|uniref:Uncharacterized protein n=1 Tax=Prunus dulcis TaxID=3755 RepID=A0AAD4UVL7_PRUDU|nr:hypothetical protein L3X38_042991 [Prunus dulcis]
MDPSEDACNSIEGGYTSPRDNVQDSDSSNNNNAIVVTQIGAILTKSAQFDPHKFHELLVMAIIMHELPFQFVEYARIREKVKLKEFLGSIPGRVCLTSDLWSSIITNGKAKKKKKRDLVLLQCRKSREKGVDAGQENCSKGISKWITEYHQSRPGLKVLQQRIDDFITAHHEKLEQASNSRFKGQKVDDDGSSDSEKEALLMKDAKALGIIQGAVRSIKLQDLCRDFEYTRMRDDETLSGYLTRLLELVNQMKGYGEDLSKGRLVQKLLISLTKEFDPVCYVIEQTKDIEMIEVQEVIAALRGFAQRLDRHAENTTKKAFSSMSINQKGS